MSSPPSKKSRVVEEGLRSDLLTEEVVKWITSTLTNSKVSTKLENNGVQIVLQPFPVLVVHDFIQNPELLRLAKKEAKNIIFNQKSNDLYQFKQSVDVKNLTNFTSIPQLYDVIRNEAREWVGKVFGNVTLEKQISATFSSYKYHDRLLCHDDKCEDRCIAFILYLVENWNKDDGGALHLFNTDSQGYPQDIIESIYPEFNTLVLFEVSNKSFHQVSEILSATKERLSINGWFHSSGKKLNKVSCPILINETHYENNKEFDLKEYFLSTYFKEDNILHPKFWTEIEKDVKNIQIQWSNKGPANVRKYEVAAINSLPASLQNLKEIFESKTWLKYLKSITGLDLAPSETSDLKIWESGVLPQCTFEVQRWTPSCYTLIHDLDSDFHKETLDVILRIPFEESTSNNSDTPTEDSIEPGHICYVDGESRDEECLLHIGYNMNSLALVFRDTKTLRFTKYLDSTAKPFYQVFCTYRPWEPPIDQPHLRHCEESSESESESEDSATEYSN